MDRRVASDNCLEISNETERAGGRGEAVQARRVSVLLFPCWSNDLHDTPWTILELSPSLKNISFVAITRCDRNKSTLFTVYLNEFKSKIAGRSYRCKRAITRVHPSRKFLVDFLGFLLNLRSSPPFLSNVSPASDSWEDNPRKST